MSDSKTDRGSHNAVRALCRVILLFSSSLSLMVSCGSEDSITMTGEEAVFINESPDTMRILSIDNSVDSVVLRKCSANFSPADLKTWEYGTLAVKMVSTLKGENSGVGLAAPQVGINRRVVAVMRLDKDGKPIEVYPNLRIVECRGEMKACPEGCLSVPGKSGKVLRYWDITIAYTDINSVGTDRPREIREDVSGFTAVIFQHEADHLDGVIFTDKTLTE